MKKMQIALTLAAFLAVTAQSPTATAALLSLADSPIFLLTSVEPNIMLTFDDSGSMSWGYAPDSLDDGVNFNPSTGTNNINLRSVYRGCSSRVNTIYYNPAVTYSPPVRDDGTSYPNASFTAAWMNGYNTTTGSAVNLNTSYRMTWTTNTSSTNSTGTSAGTIAACGTGTTSGQQAYYFVFDTTLAGTGSGALVCPNPADDRYDGCYRRVNVASTSAEAQNFANWYQYYRTRVLLAKTAAGRAFLNLSDNVRLGYQRLNTCNSAFGTAPSGTCPGTVVTKYDTTGRSTFFTWLYNSGAQSGTPLIPATVRAGTYLSTSNSHSPWAQDPGNSIGTEYSCRQNFHIAFTDGYWNSGGGVGGNRDNSSVTFPNHADTALYNPGTYNPAGLPATRRIYPDANSDFLADNAFYYWSRDARNDLDNDVPQYIVERTGTNDEQFYHPENDPATWQHLVNFTVGLGLPGILTYSADQTVDDYKSLLDGSKTWPTGSASFDGPHKTDDLWHAAVNSRGRYFSAANPNELVDAFTQVLNAISARNGSGAALAANAGSVGTNTQIYQARFNSSDWTGSLYAVSLDLDGNPVQPPLWDAAIKLSGDNSTAGQHFNTGREIITFHSGTRQGEPFRWGNISAAQQTELNKTPTGTADTEGPDRLNYLRGETVNEGTGNNYR
ncbi:MAG TPA: hypothetical protein VGA00_10365, partial [Acidiferrobacterales bacterium]